jgi:hypothetical protein
MFDVLFALNGCKRRGVLLAVHQHLTILPTKTVNQPIAMLIDTADQIVRQTDIERAARTARQKLDPMGFHC